MCQLNFEVAAPRACQIPSCRWLRAAACARVHARVTLYGNRTGCAALFGFRFSRAANRVVRATAASVAWARVPRSRLAYAAAQLRGAARGGDIG
eukprot:3730213-Pleurochrysis_carterae.AAC.3